MKKNNVGEILAAFHRLDIDKDGVISISELEHLFTELLYDKSIIPKLMKIMDLNNSGFIDYTEFLIATIS